MSPFARPWLGYTVAARVLLDSGIGSFYFPSSALAVNVVYAADRA